ncbi:MAG: hypothetical protein MCS20_00960 [Candidatus Phytoplasma mali]|nr:hypothetical protein [Candidatus Karelsulcia muelleri]MCG7201971.1 hypothetical protein [Candidatus Phytoplasma mali]
MIYLTFFIIIFLIYIYIYIYIYIFARVCVSKKFGPQFDQSLRDNRFIWLRHELPLEFI